MIPQSQVQANITLSGAPFHVNHNLYLAMLHLRSPTHPFTLWVDAICIDQADMEERNAQVAMMSFIYTRALKVAAWLGVKEYKNQVDLFRSMSSDWKAGQARQFAASLVGETKLHYSLEPDKITLARIAECSYWVRLWIVQEACLPRLLVFVYGSKIWAYEDLHQFEAVKAIRSEPPGPRFSEDVVDDEFGDMLRLFDTRNAKYTDTMMLEYLLELFAKSRCAESRDRVYGLLGLANDTSPFSRVDDYVDSIDEYINSLDPQQEILPEPQRGMGSFKVDYSRSFYDIWTDVVKFVFFRAKNIQRRYSKQSMNVESALFDENKAFIREERRISVVRTAGIVQQALDQKVEEEAANLNYAKGSASSYYFFRSLKADEANKSKQINENPIIRAIGYVSGEILRLGPEYSSLVGSFRAQQEWVNCWGSYYHKPFDLETLRRMDEQYAAKIMSYEDKVLARIQEIRSPNTVAWRIADGSRRPETSHPNYVAEFNNMWDSKQNRTEEPRICLGTGYLIAVVPPGAMVGDIVVRFWNCDAAILMRPMYERDSQFILVGRADVAEHIDRKATPSFDISAEEGLLGYITPGFDQGDHPAGAVYVDMDLRTLQTITASISTYRQQLIIVK
jgi:hypothetical protein